MEIDCRKQVEKHLADLPCPICQHVAYFNDRTLRSHLRTFHRRVDVEELVELWEKMCGITPGK